MHCWRKWSWKTTFIKRHITGDFQEEYYPTDRVISHELTLSTNYGKVMFSLWDGVKDCSTEDNYDMNSFFHTAASGYIIFVNNDEDIDHQINHWIDQIKLQHPTCLPPLVIALTKVDIKKPCRGVVKELVKYPPLGYKVYTISSKSNYDYEKPLLELARQGLSYPHLILT